MLKTAIAAVVLSALPNIAWAQPKAELLIGWLDQTGGTISQVVGVRNNGRLPIRAVKIGCHFSRYSEQLGAGSVDIENIGPTATGYKTILVAGKTAPNRSTCRITSLKQ